MRRWRGKREGGGGDKPLYSRKLHIFVRRDRTSCITSFMVLDLSLELRVVNHFARRWRAGG